MTTQRSAGILLGALLALVAAALLAAGSRSETAARAASSSWAARIDAIAIPAVDALIATQGSDGIFRDPVKGEVGSDGLPSFTWVALRQARRMTGDDAQRRLVAAHRALRRGTGSSSILPKWPLAMLVNDGLQDTIPDGDRATRVIANLPHLHSPGVADSCFQRTDCFNNYKLVSAALSMELAAGGHGGRDGRSGAALRAHTLRLLRDSLPAATSTTARVWQPGMSPRTATALSDPHRYPLAYQAFCTALLTRVIALGGNETPESVWRLERAALWELVGMTAPNGEISWLGRGQDEVWTLAASLYSGLEGSLLMAHRDPLLASRLRRLAQVELAALAGRLGPGGLRMTPTGRAGRAGIDHYASSVGNASLALVWMELARDAAPAVRGEAHALPAEQQGGRASDPAGTGLLTLRRGDIWMGVHRRRDHDLDARQDFGLLRALRRLPGGRWVSLLPARPVVRPGAQTPWTGPALVRHGKHSSPVVTGGGVGERSVTLHGHWSGAAGSAEGQWSWTPTARAVRMRSTCPRGASLQLIAWLPRIGTTSHSARVLSRGGYVVSFSQPVSVEQLAGRYGSAREPHLAAYRVSTRCSGRPLDVMYSGRMPAAG
jgi:hypothetical protein